VQNAAGQLDMARYGDPAHGRREGLDPGMWQRDTNARCAVRARNREGAVMCEEGRRRSARASGMLSRNPAETGADDDHTRVDPMPFRAQRTETVNTNGSSMMERMSWPTSIRIAHAGAALAATSTWVGPRSYAR
jgi:hypothetical protein